MGWQKTFSLPRRAKGCHLVTDEVQAQIKDGLKGVKVSMNSLTLNENYDPDMDMALDHVVPESLNWEHTAEGPDVSHTKSALIGTTVTVPITDGRLNLGTWQGERGFISANSATCHTREPLWRPSCRRAGESTPILPGGEGRQDRRDVDAEEANACNGGETGE
ncbi:hypothetical protein EV122DRAFT_257567 [Schizophyllum commune]